MINIVAQYNTMTIITSNSKNIDIQSRYNLVCENLSNFGIDLWTELHNFITNNPGKTTLYHITNYKNHKFSVDSFEYLLTQINRNRNTFHDIGPFVEKNGNWYCKSKTKDDFISIIDHQQKEIDRLKELLHQKTFVVDLPNQRLNEPTQ
jgi:hypothetical protein